MTRVLFNLYPYAFTSMHLEYKTLIGFEKKVLRYTQHALRQFLLTLKICLLFKSVLDFSCIKCIVCIWKKIFHVNISF